MALSVPSGMTTSILVTGGTGTLGLAVVHRLLGDGRQVRVPDLGGPDVRAVRELARRYLRASGRHRPVLPVRLPGRAFSPFRQGGNLTPDHAVGRITFDEFLAERFGR